MQPAVWHYSRFQIHHHIKHKKKEKITPLQTDMEPTNSPLEKENILPNLDVWVPC